MAKKKTSPAANEHKHVLVLGAGHIGTLIAHELYSQGNTVTIIDKESNESIRNKSPWFHATFAMDGLKSVRQWQSKKLMLFYNTDIWDFLRYDIGFFKEFELIINALPGDVSYKMLETLIPLGIDIIDISFMEQDPRDLHETALLYNTRVIYDCGIAPGLCNAILGHHLTNDSNIYAYECYVGGLPVIRTEPFQYKTLFSIKDTLAEYTRPARYIADHDTLINDSMDYHDITFDKIGTVEAFPTDGLRSLLDLDVSNMVEYTLRHSGHMYDIKLLNDMGMLDKDSIDETIKRLDKYWSWGDVEPEDFLFMQINIAEYIDSQHYHRYTIYDRATDGVTAMARTTGYSCIAMIDLLKDMGPGVHPPENAIQDKQGALTTIFDYLRGKGISIEKTTENRK